MRTVIESVIVCGECARKVAHASAALRRHAALMDRAIHRAQSGSLTEEEHQNFRAELRASLNEAEAVWDSYHQHVKEHGAAEKYAI